MLYRNQIGEAQSPPPYTFPNVSINSFRLEDDFDQLTDEEVRLHLTKAWANPAQTA